jgi:hypothetical protein
MAFRKIGPEADGPVEELDKLRDKFRCCGNDGIWKHCRKETVTQRAFLFDTQRFHQVQFQQLCAK